MDRVAVKIQVVPYLGPRVGAKLEALADLVAVIDRLQANFIEAVVCLPGIDESGSMKEAEEHLRGLELVRREPFTAVAGVAVPPGSTRPGRTSLSEQRRR